MEAESKKNNASFAGRGLRSVAILIIGILKISCLLAEIIKGVLCFFWRKLFTDLKSKLLVKPTFREARNAVMVDGVTALTIVPRWCFISFQIESLLALSR